MYNVWQTPVAVRQNGWHLGGFLLLEPENPTDDRFVQRAWFQGMPLRGTIYIHVRAKTITSNLFTTNTIREAREHALKNPNVVFIC